MPTTSGNDTHSKVMCWVAFDRAIAQADRFGLPGPIERWRKLRAHLHAEICRRGFDRSLGNFVRAYGSRTLDASTLLLPWSVSCPFMIRGFRERSRTLRDG
jgi:GH15 family glucan-1,4-alpha-glucosidase